MISVQLLEALSRMNVPMVIFLGNGEEDSELLKEMSKPKMEVPHIVPSPG